MSRIKWCLKQKRGIELIESNEDLARAYIKKAENALRAASDLQNNLDWEISSSYYAMYFSLYAILIRIGIKSEIHSCTIEFMREFLKDYFSEKDISLIEKTQKVRIDVQYYSDRDVSKELYNKIKKQRALFLAKCKDVLNQISEDLVKTIRRKIKEYYN